MRSEIVLPSLRASELVDRAHHALYELGVVDKEEGDGGVAYVDGCGAAVREAFLGYKEHLALLVKHELVSGNCLAVCKLKYLGVLLATRSDRVDKHSVSKVGALLCYRLVIGVSLCYLCGYRGAVLVPIGAKVLAEIFNTVNIVVSKRDERGLLKLKLGAYVSRLVALAKLNRGSSLGGEIEVSPVDTVIVARSRDYVLSNRSYSYALELAKINKLARGCFGFGSVSTDLLGDRNLYLYLMLLFVDALALKLKVAYGASEQVEIVQENRRGEYRLEAHACGLEYVGGGKCVAVNRHLLHCGKIVLSDETVVNAVDGCNTENAVGPARPMHRIGVGELV